VYSKMSYNDTNDPIVQTKALPVAALGHGRGRKIVYTKDIEQLAINIFDSSKKAITVGHIVAQFGVNKEHARRINKRCVTNHVLFAPENHKPQRYYPVLRRPQVIEYLYTKKRLPVQPTGTRHTLSHYYALFNALESQKASNFLDTLRLLPLSPKYTHNFHMKTIIDKQHYLNIDSISENQTKGKSFVERIGLRQVTYTYYPRGSITMEVGCSYTPFRIGSENDVNILFAFIGQIKDRMTIHLNDPRERITPDINVWTLKQCDVNVDIELTDLGQVTLQDIQISTLGRVLRAYVKILESKSVMRWEETIRPNSLLLEVFDSITHPNRALENQMKELSSKVDSIIAENSRKSKGKEYPEGSRSL
jgi:hypothetical protein